MMSRIMAPSIALLLASASMVVAADEIKSGLQVGDRAGAFNVKDVTGPNKGRSLCYR